MFKYKDKNVITIGFFGQSGAGKSTLIRSVPQTINNKSVVKKLDIIRGLYTTNPDKYISPDYFIKQKTEINNSSNPGSLIAENYLKYIKSQLQLLNDFSTEVFENTRLDYLDKTYLFFDRTPIDFYALTECALVQLYDVFGGKLNNKSNSLFRDILKKTALENTIKFFDVIFVVYPWSRSKNGLFDGIRDQYLSEYYIGDNWYNKINDFDLSKIKIFDIKENIVTIEKRVDYIMNCLKGV